MLLVARERREVFVGHVGEGFGPPRAKNLRDARGLGPRREVAQALDERLKRRVSVRRGDAAHAAVVPDQINQAVVCERSDREVREAFERRLVVER